MHDTYHILYDFPAFSLLYFVDQGSERKLMSYLNLEFQQNLMKELFTNLLVRFEKNNRKSCSAWGLITVSSYYHTQAQSIHQREQLPESGEGYNKSLLLSHFSHVRLCATPQTAAHQAPLTLGFSRQEHWSGLPFPPPVHESEK